MRAEISNKLLLKVIQAWDPDEAELWSVDKHGDLRQHTSDGIWYIREPNNEIPPHYPEDDWYEACELVEFLLKDRPDLELLKGSGGWKDEVPEDECLKATNGCWDSDPWEYSTTPVRDLVIRIKSYEYLKEWKERQEGNMKIETPSVAGAMTFRPNGPKAISDFTGGEPKQTLYISTEHPLSILNGSKIRLSKPVPFDMKPGEILSLINCEGIWWETSRVTAIDPDDVTLSIEGQSIEGMEIHDDVLGVPATYDRICPRCNGSKEVVGWHGKESCNVC